MRRSLLFTLLLIVSTNLFATTYYWVGGTASAQVFNDQSNWSSVGVGGAAVGSSGTNISFTTSDILTFDGSDVSSAVGTQTGNISITQASTTISVGQMIFQNSVSVKLPNATTTRTYNVGGGLSGTDLDIQSGSTFIVGGTGTGTSLITLVLVASNTANIAGTLDIGNAIGSNNTLFTVSGTATVANGGRYKHGITSGTFPAFTWATGSTCEVTGIVGTQPGASFTQSFYNLIWNATGQSGSLGLAGVLTTVLGDFTITSTNNQQLRLNSTQSTTLTVSGNLVLNCGTGLLGINSGNGSGTLTVTGTTTLTSGVLTPNVANNTGTPTLNLNGGLTIQGGTLDMQQSGNTASANNGVLNIRGDFSMTSGSLIKTGTATGASINFAKTGTQTYSKSGGTISGNPVVNINSGATVDFGTSVLDGITGTFTLASGAGIKIGSTAGITSSGATGNIQTTGTRTFNTGANYTYNGSAAQVTGAGLPATVNTLTISNSLGVTTTSDLTVSTGLTLTAGAFDNNGSANDKTVTLTNGSTITRSAGTLSVAPVFGSAGTDRVNVTITGTCTSDNELLGTTGGIGTLTITTGTYTLGVSPTVDNLSIAASQTLDAADKVITPRASGAVTVNGTLKTANLNGFSGAANTAINNTNSPTITLGAASTIEYNAAAGTQTVDGRTDYVNLTLSGNADKNISTGAEVSGNFTVSGSGTTTPPTTMTFDGASAQSIAGLVYTNVAFSGAGTKTFNSDGSLQGAMTFASGTGTIDFDGSGDNKVFTLKSNATGTARIGNTNSNSATLTGNVGVERYIPSSRRAWRLLTAPMTGSSNNSVYYNWQNNGTPGSGFEMWSPAGGNGLTTGGGNTSIRKYTATGWVNISNTQTEQLFSSSTNNAFAVFVTGTYGSGNISTGFAAATAKGTGTLRSGDITFAGLLDTKHNLVGNPYASPIDIDAVLSDAANNTKFDQFVWLWDPAINSFGGYVTYDVTVNSYTASTNYPADVQSGQAFFVKATGGTQTLTIKESQKTAGSTNNVYRSNTVAEIFKTAMYRLDATPLLLDAVMNAYNTGYNAAVDNGDAAKFSNTGENLSIIRDGAYLSIEHRPLVNLNDTIYLQVWNMQQANYRFTFEALNMSSSGLVAYLEDAFLNTSTPLSLNGNTVNVDFTVTASALSTGDRFRIVFKPASALPVTITNIKAYEKGATIAVEWTSLSESNIDHYDVERSADGRNFTTLSAVHAKGNNGLAVNYQSIDADPLNGNNYYRIKVVGASAADVKYTSVVKVNRQKGTEGIGVYPNPVKGDAIQLQLNNIKKGTYTLTLYNNLGERVLQKVIQHNGGAAVETIALNSGIASGVYILKLAGSEMNVQQRIIIERP